MTNGVRSSRDFLARRSAQRGWVTGSARCAGHRAGHAAVVAALEDLARGRWWPPLDRLFEGVEHRAPDALYPAPALG
jgi:hypothetical protein